MSYIGTPIDTTNQFQSLQGKRFSGDGSTTAFTLDIAPSSVFDIEVFVENVRQDPNSAYGVSGTTLTFTGAPPSGTNNVYVIHQAKAVGTIDVPASGVVPASLASNIISGQTELAATPADTDEFLVSDAGTIKRIDFSHIKGQGKIAQVVNTTKTDTFSTTSGSYTDVTGLSAAITPSATSSKIFVILSLYISGDTQTANNFIKLVRDSTGLQESIVRIPQEAQGVYRKYNVSVTDFDSPSSTSELTYKAQALTNSGTLYVNRAANTGGFSATSTATLTLMEVLA